jgi:anti-sigma B factor antagonist
MQIQERAVGPVTILDLSGKLTHGGGDALLRDKIHSLLHQGRKSVVINLGGVDYIDSAGLGEVVSSLTTMSRDGGGLKLLNLTKRVHDLLAITKLLTVFETFDSEADVLKSFSSVSA